MSTVTFIPGKEFINFTSIRDETELRSAEMVPSIHQLSDGRVVYPGDADAEGAWIAGHENGNVVIFLNGARVPHKSHPPYRKIRQLVLLDLIDHITPVNCFLAVKLNNVEPFTAIVRDNTHLFECYWNGKEKHYNEVDVDRAHIWTSVADDSNAVGERRRSMFADFIAAHPNASQKQLLRFYPSLAMGGHEPAGKKATAASITSIMLNEALVMVQVDSDGNPRSSQQLRFHSSMAGN